MSAEFLVLMLMVGMCGCLVAVYKANQDKDIIQEFYDKKLQECISLQQRNNRIEMENIELRYQLNKMAINQSAKANFNNKTTYTNKEMVEAVKYAMKAAHPDNGGKQEDFIKFNALYNKMR